MVAKAFVLITTVIPAVPIPLTRDRERDTIPNSVNIREMRHGSWKIFLSQ